MAEQIEVKFQPDDRLSMRNKRFTHMMPQVTWFWSHITNPIHVTSDDFIFSFCLFGFLLITPMQAWCWLRSSGDGLGSLGPEFKSRSAVELIPGGVNLTCHPSEVGKMSASIMVYCVRVATRPGLCQIAKETDQEVPTLCTDYGPNLLFSYCDVQYHTPMTRWTACCITVC